MKVILKITTLLLILYFLPKICNKCTGGFTLSRIRSSLSYNPNWDVKNPPLENVFDHRFFYFASGGQCFAFVSEDGNYVLKFFKHHQRRLPFWLKILPLPSKWAEKREAQRKKRTWKLERDFRSYKLAMENLSEETGLLYVHLNKTNHLSKKARIVDKNGIEHSVNLDQMEFILQKKAILAYPYLLNLINKNDLVGAKQALQSICALILKRSQKGIFDEDAKINRNFGFINNRAILIDVGRLKPDPKYIDPQIQRQDLINITKRLKDYLTEISPELAEYLQKYTQLN